MAEKARFATIHWFRFGRVTVPGDLDLSGRPEAALSWKIGPSGKVGPDGYRLPSPYWAGLGLYGDRESALGALERIEAFAPFAGEALEAKHMALAAVAHKGACNHLERGEPGAIFEPAEDPVEGRMAVVTTAGFVPGSDPARMQASRNAVDDAYVWLRQMPGMEQVLFFTPHTAGDDGVTMSVWEDSRKMLTAAYQPGQHRGYVDRYKAETMADRTSFTRFRILGERGVWSGGSPLEVGG